MKLLKTRQMMLSIKNKMKRIADIRKRKLPKTDNLPPLYTLKIEKMKSFGKPGNGGRGSKCDWKRFTHHF